jgi:hypothetical protein
MAESIPVNSILIKGKTNVFPQSYIDKILSLLEQDFNSLIFTPFTFFNKIQPKNKGDTINNYTLEDICIYSASKNIAISMTRSTWEDLQFTLEHAIVISNERWQRLKWVRRSVRPHVILKFKINIGNGWENVTKRYERLHLDNDFELCKINRIAKEMGDIALSIRSTGRDFHNWLTYWSCGTF